MTDLKVSKMDQQILTYCLTEKAKYSTSDEEYHDYFDVVVKNGKVTTIKFDGKEIHARHLYELRNLFLKLDEENFTLSYGGA